MASSSGPGPRPTSPVEEDLQKLYNEVWAQFAQEAPASERDLENIYNGYADDNELAPQSLGNVLVPQKSEYIIAHSYFAFRLARNLRS